MKSLTLVALASFMFFFYLVLTGISGLLPFSSRSGNPINQALPQVQGVSTDTFSNRVDILLNNSVNGEATLELSSDGLTKISGMELNFKLDDTLEVRDVICNSEYNCYFDLSQEGVLALTLFRNPDVVNTVLPLKSTFATVVYSPDSYGELVLNNDGKDSTVIDFSTNEDILSDEPIYLQAGWITY